MPEYTYKCSHCNEKFSVISSIEKYKDKEKCSCGKKADRDYINDCSTINGNVKKSDGELKTLGDLANRNRDRMSSDQIQEMNYKHNSYKYEEPQKALPKGMKRMKTQKTRSKP
jgi:hypothetical protein